MKEIDAVQGNYVILASDNWWIYDNNIWRPMTVEEQLLISE
jgi:hypothetical protein